MAYTMRQRLDALQAIEEEQEALDKRRVVAEAALLEAVHEHLPDPNAIDPEALVLGANACNDTGNPSERCIYDNDSREECLFCGEPEQLETK
jgi:hypothetical protein